jgi:DNA-binding MarR family transcriptional regulator
VSLNAEGAERRSGDEARRQLIDDLVGELTSWNPRDWIAAFRKWHHGSVSIIHLNVLTVLDTDGPLAMSRLAEILDVSVASTTGLIDRMEKRGLVERAHDEHDRRVVLVHPTAAGAGIFRDIEGRRREAIATLLDRLTDAQLAGFLDGTRAMREARTALMDETSRRGSDG